jgi:tight adherence protein C
VSTSGLVASAAVIGACLSTAAACVGARGTVPLSVPRAAASVSPVRRQRPGRRASRERARAFRAEIPQFLDLLAAGSTAGLSVEASFRQAAACLRGPLGDDLGEVLRSVDLGVPWREALATYVERTGDPDLSRTASVLARTETLGVPLRDATRDLAATVREARRATTLQRARTAPVRMLFPLVFLILPAFLLLTVVPVLITTVRSIR